MKKQQAVLRLLALGGIAPALICGAAAITPVYVSTGGDNVAGDGTVGNPYATIQKGVTEVDSAGTVIVEAGLYELSSTIIIDKPLTLQGPQMDVDPRPYSTLGGGVGSTRVPGDDTTEAIIDGNNGGSPLGGLVIIESSDVTINGFQFRTSNGDMVQSPETSPWSNIKVSYNLLTEAFTDDAIQLRNVDGGLIEYNYIFNTFQDAISICCLSTNGTIQYNEIANNSSDNGSIYVYDFDAVDRELNHVIRGNWIYNVLVDDAIEVGVKNGDDVNDTGVLVENNVVGIVPEPVRVGPDNPSNIADDGIEVHVSNVQIIGNVFSGVIGDSGTGLYDGAVSIEDDCAGICVVGNTFIENFLSLPTAAALHIDPSADASSIVIEGNTFENNTPYAFATGNTGLVTLTGNKFIDNVASIRATTNNDLVIEGNQFWAVDGDPGVMSAISANGQFAALAFQGNEVYDGYVYTSDADYSSPAPFVNGNWYGGYYDEDPDADGLINGASAVVSPAGNPQVVTENAIVARLDRDVDGLSDAFEMYGNNSYLFTMFDTDNDGLPDGADHDPCAPPVPVKINPFFLDLDTDGDGYVDFYETNRVTGLGDDSELPALGNVFPDANPIVGLADAVRALQVVNGALPVDLSSGDMNALDVTGRGPRSLANPLQLLRFQASIRLGLPAVMGID